MYKPVSCRNSILLCLLYVDLSWEIFYGYLAVEFFPAVIIAGFGVGHLSKELSLV